MTSERLSLAVRGVVAKSQLGEGRYVPATKLSPLGRQKQRDAVKNGSYARLRQNRGAPQGRGLESVYDSAGVQPGIRDAVAEETRPSKVHSNVHYGASMSPELEAKIDRSLNSDLVRSAKRPLAFHYGSTHPGAIAAAAGAHTTTGGKGRIILNRDIIDAAGRMGHEASFASFGEMINHETAHAVVGGKNPTRFLDARGEIDQKRALGEEARADGRGVRGRGLYLRNGTIQPESLLSAAERQAKDAIGWNAKQKRDFQEALAGHRNYHQVHERVQRAYGTDRPRGPETPRFTPPHEPYRPGEPPRLPRLKFTGGGRGAAIGGAAAGAALIGGGVYALARSRRPRDHDGDGRIYDGTPQERSVTKALDVDRLFAIARGEV